MQQQAYGEAFNTSSRCFVIPSQPVSQPPNACLSKKFPLSQMFSSVCIPLGVTGPGFSLPPEERRNTAVFGPTDILAAIRSQGSSINKLPMGFN